MFHVEIDRQLLITQAKINWVNMQIAGRNMNALSTRLANSLELNSELSQRQGQAVKKSSNDLLDFLSMWYRFSSF